MAKNGFSMSNRVAVESVSAAKTLTADDCGKLIVATATGYAAYQITLPTVASAEAGWNCEVVVVSGAVAKDLTVSQGSDGTDIHLIGINAVSGALVDEVSFADVASVTFPSESLSNGDRIKVRTDGSRWYAESFSNAAVETA